MKKIFALFSLIAILTVAFSSNANAIDNDNNVEFVVSVDNPSLVAVATVDAVSVDGFIVTNLDELTIVEGVLLPDIDFVELLNEGIINVAVDSVSYLEGESISVAVNTVSLDKDNSNSFADLPIDYGIRNIEFELTEPLPNLNEYVSEYNCRYGYETPNFLKNISSNIGKLTTFNI